MGLVCQQFKQGYDKIFKLTCPTYFPRRRFLDQLNQFFGSDLSRDRQYRIGVDYI